MENRRLLTRTGWFIVLKATILGAVCGALLTFVIRWLDATFADGENLTTMLLTAPYVATLWFPVEVCRILGWAWPLAGSSKSFTSVLFIYVTNTVFLAGVGTVIGLLFTSWKTLRKRKRMAAHSHIKATSILVLIAINSMAHDKPVHEEITQAAAISSDGLGGFLRDHLGAQNQPFLQNPKLIASSSFFPSLGLSPIYWLRLGSHFRVLQGRT